MSIAVGVTAIASGAQAATITNGFTFTVADAFTGPPDVGTHFHSSTGGDFGNPAGLAEVGELGVNNETIKGLSEYDLSGLVNGTAFVTFNVFNDSGGLFGQSKFDGMIAVDAYAGNNAENLSDFEAASIGSVGVFSTAALSNGDILSFDISAIFNSLIDSSAASLGIRLTALGDPAGTAIVFNDFRLTTDDMTTPIPLPGAAGLGLAGLGMIAARRRRTS